MAHQATPVHKQSLYERDYYTWALEQARALREHRLEDLDWDNVADEVAVASAARPQLEGHHSCAAR
jgi:hypothetical protein